MMREQIKLYKPYLGNNQNLSNLLDEVLKSGHLVQGKFVNQFEQKVATYLGVKHAIAVSSGTAALHLTLIAVGVKIGDEVIIPSYTFPATANVVELLGAIPIMVDVDLNTFTMQIDKIERVITPKTKAIIPVHLFGNPADMDPIIKIAKNYGLAVIEDAAGALGAEYKGKKCGTIGMLGCFSFHPRKVITTGEGGMIVTNNDALAERIRLLRNHGLQTHADKKDLIVAGLNYRMNELEAVLGINQLNELDEIIKEREKMAKIYIDYLSKIPNIIFQSTLPGSKNVWQAFVVYCPNINVSLLLDAFRKENIEVNIGTYALHILHYYSKKYGYKPLDFPNALELHSKSFALPFYNGISQDKIERVIEVLRNVIYEN